ASAQTAPEGTVIRTTGVRIKRSDFLRLRPHVETAANVPDTRKLFQSSANTSVLTVERLHGLELLLISGHLLGERILLVLRSRTVDASNFTKAFVGESTYKFS